MLLGCIADDFTGAGDLANTLAREGMRTRLFIGVPQGKNDMGDCDAGVVALKTRSIPAAQAVKQSLDALEALRDLGCQQYLFKYCSTFDSTPEGNIGPVAEALARKLDAKAVIVCPAFPGTGRTVYSGHLFVNGQLLSETGMARHPLTPMTDPDIRRWLARQTVLQSGHIPHSIVRQGADAIATALASRSNEGMKLVVVDATDETDLREIGAAAADAPLVTGGSGIAIGLPENFRRLGLLSPVQASFERQRGAALVLSGSCSVATREQVARYAAAKPAYALSIDRLLTGAPVEAEIADFLDRHRDEAPLVYSTDAAETVAANQGRHGMAEAADAIESLFGRVARQAVAGGLRKLVVAGGETSGAVVTALGLSELDVGPEIDPGVPALAASTEAGCLALALKSGNFGGPDFFEHALRRLDQPDV